MEAATLEQTDRKSAAAAAAVELSRVTMRFTTERGSITALENIDLTVPYGGFLTLLGPSVAASPRCSGSCPT